ncbi:MAG: cytochrome c oxidase subunit II [Anaerolineales bacterium]|nr:cytochrome c oxidase subunit II [Anaerolineales bacterium]
MRERTIFALVVVSLLLIAIGYFVATRLDLSWLMPVQASSRAVIVDQLFRFMLGIATVIFLIVEGALIYAVIRFRRKAGDENDAAPVHGNNALEFVWTLIPAVIVAVISIYSYQVLTQIESPVKDRLVVEMVARQFVWEFHYPEADVSSHELHLPIDRTVIFQITSEDVVHSFWVPEFRVKKDATPGQVSELVVTPTRLGRYSVLCAELCGPFHAGMIADVVVESESEFERWLAEQAGDDEIMQVQEQPDEQTSVETEAVEESQVLAEGRALYLQFGCGACHVLADAGGIGIVGPTLDGIAEIAASRRLGVEANVYLQESILAPDAYVVEGYSAGLMPGDYGDRMSEDEVEALVEYLMNQ